MVWVATGPSFNGKKMALKICIITTFNYVGKIFSQMLKVNKIMIILRWSNHSVYHIKVNI